LNARNAAAAHRVAGASTPMPLMPRAAHSASSSSSQALRRPSEQMALKSACGERRASAEAAGPAACCPRRRADGGARVALRRPHLRHGAQLQHRLREANDSWVSAGCWRAARAAPRSRLAVDVEHGGVVRRRQVRVARLELLRPRRGAARQARLGRPAKRAPARAPGRHAPQSRTRRWRPPARAQSPHAAQPCAAPRQPFGRASEFQASAQKMTSQRQCALAPPRMAARSAPAAAEA
jgi:hypothetical protein